MLICAFWRISRRRSFACWSEKWIFGSHLVEGHLVLFHYVHHDYAGAPRPTEDTVYQDSLVRSLFLDEIVAFLEVLLDVTGHVVPHCNFFVLDALKS